MPQSTSTTPQQPTPTPQPCNTCQGAQGKVIDTSSDGVIRQSWQSCSPCSGTGVQGGGH